MHNDFKIVRFIGIYAAQIADTTLKGKIINMLDIFLERMFYNFPFWICLANHSPMKPFKSQMSNL